MASQANDNNNGGSIKLQESASLKCLSVNLGIIMQDFPLFRDVGKWTAVSK